MARAKGPKPGSRDIKKAVFSGLNIQTLGAGMFDYIKWTPTLGIAAGRIDKLGADIRSFRVPLERAIKQVVIPSIQKNFQVGGRPGWPPLSDATLEIRDRLGFSGSETPLNRTGALRSVMGQFNIWTVTPTAAVLADIPQNVWYGKIHQGGYEGSGGGQSASKTPGGSVREKLERIVEKARAGGSKGRLTAAIPQRQFVLLQPEDEDEITQIFIDWLGERIDHAWAVSV